MTPPDAPGEREAAIVAQLRADLEQIAEFLEEYPRVRSTGLASLYDIVTDETRTPDRALRDVDREYRRVAPIPGGFWDQYVPAPEHGVDRAATARLDALRDQLLKTLRTWEGHV